MLADPADTLGFCPELAELLRTRRVVGASGKVFEGFAAISTPNTLMVLRRLMREIAPKRTLEVGLSFAGSCLVFASSHRELGPPAHQHVALDPFQTSVWDDCGLIAVRRAGLLDYVDFRPRFSCLELPRLVDEGSRFGLIYIDGSHLFEDVFLDAYFAVRLLEEGGVVAFDDSTDPHVRKVLTFIRRSFPSTLPEIDLSAYRPDGGRRLRYRIARRLHRTQMTAFRRVGWREREWNAPFVDF